ncbi:hypothetical protein H5T58_00500 [Candidatus Parcubacteria bacterium]|nr:hypothetical protein [Candidatus Parcubacteria bacterium]
MNNKFPSELRFDIISEDWVIIAKTRKKLPKVHKTKKEPSFKISPKDCPFCNIKGQLPPKLIFAKGQKILPKHNSKIPPNWTTIVIPNKYPALIPARKILEKKEGKFFKILKGVGYCELVVTRDHEKHFPLFEVSQIKEVIDAYQERYQALKQKPFVKYISIFHNHGPTAGASQPHPHSQIITTPLIDNDLKKALEKAKKYYESYQKCIYCEMNEWEMKVKKRIVVENELFLAICPFASKSAFQVIVSPKPHLSYFQTSDGKNL